MDDEHGTEVPLYRDKARSHKTRCYTLWIAPRGTLVRLTDNYSGHSETFAVDAGRIRFEPYADPGDDGQADDAQLARIESYPCDGG